MTELDDEGVLPPGSRPGATEAARVEIIPFEPHYRDDFERLNLEWLQKYFSVEPIDTTVLRRPEAIIREGGAILLARLMGKIVGTCALLKDGGGFELSKMSVTESCQGLGIGRRLLAAAIRWFEAHGGGELHLETNSILAPAIGLYESAGFVHAQRPGGPSAYARANVYMVYRRPADQV